MTAVVVFLVQSGLSLLVLFLMVVWFVSPYLAAQPIRKVMLLLLAPHVIHHVGLALLVPGVVAEDFPSDFALIIAIGEPTMLALFLLSMGALRYRSPLAVPLLWVFTVAGFAYNIVAAVDGAIAGSDVPERLQAHWYVSVFYVPLLAVSHVLVLLNLLRRGDELRAALAPPAARSAGA
jgi:hypothetical protein